MKKFMISTLAMAMTVAMTTTAYATSPMKPNTTGSYELQTATLTVTNTDTNETIEYVSAREYAEALSYKVLWDSKAKTITFTKGENTFVATLGSNEYYAKVKGSEAKTVELESAPVVEDGKTFVPNSFAKMLRDVPVVDPVAPGRDLSNVITVTPTVPVVDGGRDLSKYTTITPGVDVITRDLTQFDTVTPTATPLMSMEMAKIIGAQIDNEITKLTEEVELAIAADKAAYETKGGKVAEYQVPTYDVGYEIYSRNANYIKVRYFVESSMDTLDKEYPVTYDTNTGEVITLERQ